MLLRVAWSISGMGDQLQSFAFALYVLAVTGSATKFSVSLCMQVLPMILFSPFSGYISDRFDRKKQIILYDVLSGLTVFLFFFLYIIQGSLKVYQIYLCVFALSTYQTFFNAAASCVIQTVVNPADCTKQKSVDSTISSIITVVTPAISGVLFGVFGLAAILIINCISFFLSAVIEIFLHLPIAESAQQLIEKNAFICSLREGLHYMRKSPFIVSFLFTLSILNFIMPCVEIGLMTVSQKLLRLSPTMIGVESSVLSFGLLGAALFCGIMQKKLAEVSLTRIIIRSVLENTVVFFLIAIWLCFFYRLIPFIPNIIIFTVLNFAITLFTGILGINMNAQFQRQVPNELMGRTVSFVNAILTSATPLGQVTAGLLMGGLPYYAAYLMEGMLCLLLCVFSVKKAKKSAIIVE